MLVGATQAAAIEHREHRRRRVRERAEVAPAYRLKRVGQRDDRAREQVARRVAEDQQPARVVGRRAEQPFVVRVAADDAVRTTTSAGSTASGSAAMSWNRRSIRSPTPFSSASRRASPSYSCESSRLTLRAAPALAARPGSRRRRRRSPAPRRPRARSRGGSRRSAASACRGPACGSGGRRAARSAR